jgi:flagella basal body P-ring formation protein FlgA
MLSDPKDVERGDVVEIRVTSGSAKLSIPAKALVGGRRGDQVVFTNPESGRKFTARIDGPGKASVAVLPPATESRSKRGNK